MGVIRLGEDNLMNHINIRSGYVQVCTQVIHMHLPIMNL